MKNWTNKKKQSKQFGKVRVQTVFNSRGGIRL